MTDDDRGHYEQARISTVIDGRPTMVALGIWVGGGYRGKDLGNGLLCRPILGRVPVTSRQFVTGLLEQEDGRKLGLLLDDLYHPNRRGMPNMPVGMRVWRPGELGNFGELGNEELAKHCLAARPPLPCIRFALNGVDGIYAEITGWSVNAHGSARYGVRTPIGFWGNRILALGCNVSTPNPELHVMTAGATPTVCAEAWSFAKAWEPGDADL